MDLNRKPEEKVATTAVDTTNLDLNFGAEKEASVVFGAKNCILMGKLGKWTMLKSWTKSELNAKSCISATVISLNSRTLYCITESARLSKSRRHMSTGVFAQETLMYHASPEDLKLSQNGK